MPATPDTPLSLGRSLPLATRQHRALSAIPANLSNAEPKDPAARWIELAERTLVCGRMFRDGLARQAGRRQLSAAEFSILWACRRAPPAGLGQNELAANLAVSAAQVSGLVEQLRRKGFLQGHRAEYDRRCQLWRVTPAGRAKLQAALAGVADLAGRLEDQLGTGGCGALIRLLNQLAGVLRRRPGNHPPPRPSLKKSDLEAVHGDTRRRNANREGAAR